jgi:hypothetical protein
MTLDVCSRVRPGLQEEVVEAAGNLVADQAVEIR